MKVKVTTVSLATGEQEFERVINYLKPESRAWLAKHCFWAFNNGYGVASSRLVDEVEPVA